MWRTSLLNSSLWGLPPHHVPLSIFHQLALLPLWNQRPRYSGVYFLMISVFCGFSLFFMLFSSHISCRQSVLGLRRRRVLSCTVFTPRLCRYFNLNCLFLSQKDVSMLILLPDTHLSMKETVSSWANREAYV